MPWGMSLGSAFNAGVKAGHGRGHDRKTNQAIGAFVLKTRDFPDLFQFRSRDTKEVKNNVPLCSS
jgi:hypothetical protein